MYESDSVRFGAPSHEPAPDSTGRAVVTNDRGASHRPIDASPDGLRRTVDLARRALRCADALVLPPEHDAGLGATLSAEIAPDGTVVARLVVRDEPERRWSEDDWAILRDLAETLAVEIRLTGLVSRLKAGQSDATGTTPADLTAPMTEVPMTEASEEAASEDAEHRPEELHAEDETFHILLADDLDLNRKLICDMLSLDGYVVDSVADGAAAVEAVKAKAYDLVLMDMIMPGMDGMDATRAIRALPAPTCDVPIVALTAHSFREQLDNCLHAGMNATLTKPMSFDALSSAVGVWARSRRRAA